MWQRKKRASVTNTDDGLQQFGLKIGSAAQDGRVTGLEVP